MRRFHRAAVYAGLGASVALNLVLGGVLLLRHPAAPGPDPRWLESRIERVLSPPDREAFHQAMQSFDTDFEQTQPVMLARIKALVERDPYDAGALRDEMARSRHLTEESFARFESALANAFDAISPGGRHRIAEDMPPGPPPRAGRGGGRGP